jgi:curved DNA-binding protein CbpA
MNQQQITIHQQQDQDFYAVLGVQRTADQVEITRACKALSLIHHPDRGGSLEKFQVHILIWVTF